MTRIIIIDDDKPKRQTNNETDLIVLMLIMGGIVGIYIWITIHWDAIISTIIMLVQAIVIGLVLSAIIVIVAYFLLLHRKNIMKFLTDFFVEDE